MARQFNPKVSIVIPVYNGSNYIREAIDSALAQTYKNLEILVINDGSNDKGKTHKICKSYGNKIKYIEKENGGVATALNMGIKEMQGEYFSWLSHDDKYYPDKIEKQVKFLSKISDKKGIILYANYELINEKSKTISKVKFDHEMLSEKPEYSLLRGCINGITLLIPKLAFEKHGDFNTNLKCTQDYDMWRRFAKSYKFIHMDEIFSKTRIHPLQDSNKHPNVISEGDILWIALMQETSTDTMKRLEGSEYNFYREMSLFLNSTPYGGALRYAENKKNDLLAEFKKRSKLPKVTIVIPFFNRIPLLINALKSVQEQTYKNIEILLINDGSVDNLLEIKRMVKDDKRIKLVDIETNRGAAAARNLGIGLATGEYIAFLDSDDQFLPKKIEEQLTEMCLTEYKVSHTSYIRKENLIEYQIKSGNLSGKVIPQIIGSCTIATPTVMIQTQYLRENNFRFREDFKIGEDVCFWLDILRNTKLLGIEKAYTIVNIKDSSAAIDIGKQLTGLTNILNFIFSDKEYSHFHHEISNLLGGFIELSDRITEKEIKEGDRQGISWADKKPSEPLKKLIFLIKYQGFWVTIQKLSQKLRRKLFYLNKKN